GVGEPGAQHDGVAVAPPPAEFGHPAHRDDVLGPAVPEVDLDHEVGAARQDVRVGPLGERREAVRPRGSHLDTHAAPPLTPYTPANRGRCPRAGSLRMARADNLTGPAARREGQWRLLSTARASCCWAGRALGKERRPPSWCCTSVWSICRRARSCARRWRPA